MTNGSVHADVVIVGGGIIGCSIAYRLAEMGIKPLVVDQGADSGQASRAGAGMLGAQVEIEQPGPMFELCLKSRSMFATLSDELRERTGIDIELVHRGIFRIAETDNECADLLKKQAWQRQHGCRAVWLDAGDLGRAVGSALLPTAKGALFLPDDAQIRVPQLLLALRSAILRLGGAFADGVAVEGFVVRKDRVQAILTTTGPIETECCVMAAGAWSGRLAEQVGLHLPVFPIRGQSMFLSAPSAPTPWTIFKHGAYVVPKKNGELYVGATEDQVGFDPTPSTSATDRLRLAANAMMPMLTSLPIHRPIAGLRPASSDGLPLLGNMEPLQNVFVATGHYRNGVLLSAVTGRAIAQLIGTGNPGMDLSAFSPLRFQGSHQARAL